MQAATFDYWSVGAAGDNGFAKAAANHTPLKADIRGTVRKLVPNSLHSQRLLRSRLHEIGQLAHLLRGLIETLRRANARCDGLQ